MQPNLCDALRFNDLTPNTSGRRRAVALMATVALSCLIVSRAPAAVSVITFAPGAEAAAIAGHVVEDFEDLNLMPGFSVTLSNWRNSANVVTANPAVTYAGTMPATWSPSAISAPLNAWDGTHAFVNGANLTWTSPFAASLDFEFDPPLLDVGMGLANFQHDDASGYTFHTVTVNGIAMGTLESMPHWVSTVTGKNLYLLVAGDGDTPIHSVVITANTHYDGMVVDKLALGPLAVPTSGTTWGGVKSLFR